MTILQMKLVAAGDEQPNPDAPRVTFEMFWNEWPRSRRIAKKQAVEQWKKVHPENHQKIVDAVSRFKTTEQWKEKNGFFIPYAFRWLRDERWTDEIEGDITMGICCWNIYGNRGDDPRCAESATVEKRGVVYCKAHGERVR